MRILCILFLFFPLDILFLYIRSCDHFYDIHCTYFLFYDVDVCFFHLFLYVLFLFSLYAHVSYICMQSTISVSHKNTLMSFI